MEQLLTTSGYSTDDLTITSCPSAEQVSILLSSASILAAEAIVNFSASQRKISASSSDAGCPTPPRKVSLDKKVSFESSSAPNQMENLKEVSESSGNNSNLTSPTTLSPIPPLPNKEEGGGEN